MVVVFGSINLDLVVRVQRFPLPGETLAADSLAMYAGGKGANQALAAARAGARVAMVGAVGRDAYATPALAELRGGDVDVSCVRAVDGSTGIALIQVTPAGENIVLVVAAANGEADPDWVPAAWIAPGTVVVLQQEVPAQANLAVATRARAGGARVVLNAAPARAVDDALLAFTDIIVVNEMEARTLAAGLTLPSGPAAFVTAYAKRNGGIAIVTLGARGVVAAGPDGGYALLAPHVAVVDSTGAGDAFVGALAAALAGGHPLQRALACAVAAGSLACTRDGAQPSLPHAAQIAALASTLAPSVLT